MKRRDEKGRFVKGYKLSREHKEKLIKANTGLKRSKETRRKLSLANQGRKYPQFRGKNNPACRPEVREKIRRKTLQQFKKGMPQTTRDKLSKLHTGMKHTKETKEKIRKNHRRHQTPETVAKMIKTRRKNKSFRQTKESIKKIKQARMKQVIPLKDTSIELALQEELKKRNVQFQIHYPIKGQPDIFIEPNICVFADGDYWHNYPKGRPRDKNVTSYLKEKGYVVLRFWETDINNDVSSCVDKIIEVI